MYFISLAFSDLFGFEGLDEPLLSDLEVLQLELHSFHKFKLEQFFLLEHSEVALDQFGCSPLLQLFLVFPHCQASPHLALDNNHCP